jgi:hypothetical protein
MPYSVIDKTNVSEEPATFNYLEDVHGTTAQKTVKLIPMTTRS